MKTAMLFACAVVTLAVWYHSASISGRAYVVDGDTIRIRSQSIRLQGIDAEELSEPHGDGARAALQAAIGSREVLCEPDGTTSYNRIVARCYVGSLDIGMAVVATGWALDCARYSHGYYREYELPGAREHLIQKGYCR